jgi:hypothetical protein
LPELPLPAADAQAVEVLVIKNIHKLAIILALMVLINCSENSSQLPSDYSASLIILKGASNVQYTNLNGTD